jgi:monomeric sarcosine oxidase
MRVVVVGAGVFGVWTAHHLLDRGAEVMLVDAYGPAHSRSSSGDETRIVRCGYGPDVIYSDMARRSRIAWRELDARTAAAEPLWHSSGVLWMAAGADAYTSATQETLERVGETVDVLSQRELRSRYPQIDPAGIELALFERDSGVVAAKRAVRTLAAELEGRGVTLLREHIETLPDSSVIRTVRTRSGANVAGDGFVFACGAWLPSLFPMLLHGRIRPTRQVVVYFGTPAGESRFLPSNFPAWIDFPAGIYGTPDIDARGVKVGIDAHGAPIDPDADDRLADSSSVERARQWLAQRVPALGAAPIVEARVCAYENTATGDFLVDRHPQHDNVWLVGGGSGHGFKHGPAVGELAAQMVLGDRRPDPRFTLLNKTADARRAIY